MLITETVIYRGKEKHYAELSKHSMIPLKVKCDDCGKIFDSTKYQLERNKHQFCQACALRKSEGKTLPIGKKYGKLTILKPSNKSGRSICQCECGNMTEVDNWQLKSGRTKSCGCSRSENGKRVAEMYLSKYQHKETHPNWKGGIADERSCIGATKAYREWQREILNKGKCEKCGSSENLRTHHIYNFQDYPELRLDIENGACLCEKCHRQFHKLYGLKNTTLEQYNEYLQN